MCVPAPRIPTWPGHIRGFHPRATSFGCSSPTWIGVIKLYTLSANQSFVPSLWEFPCIVTTVVNRRESAILSFVHLSFIVLLNLSIYRIANFLSFFFSINLLPREVEIETLFARYNGSRGEQRLRKKKKKTA